MAIAYYLTIWSEHHQMSVNAVRETLMSEFSLEANPLSDLLVTQGVTVSIFAEAPDEVEPVEARGPGVCISFRINKFGDYELGIVKMLQMTKRILRNFDVNAVLTFEFEDVVLRSSRGQLVLADDPEFWTLARRAIFSDM